MNKTCKDCIHYEVCEYIDDGIQLCCVGDKLCELFKDKDRFIELPCAVGDTVYCVVSSFIGKTSRRKKAIKPKVIDFIFTLPFMAESNGTILKERDFGKTVFLTKEDAEAELKKRGE
jgi:hypothetical protein